MRHAKAAIYVQLKEESEYQQQKEHGKGEELKVVQVVDLEVVLVYLIFRTGQCALYTNHYGA